MLIFVVPTVDQVASRTWKSVITFNVAAAALVTLVSLVSAVSSISPPSPPAAAEVLIVNIPLLPKSILYKK